MKKSQHKKAAEYVTKAVELKIDEIYKHQKHYKTLGGFVRAYGSKKFNEIVLKLLSEFDGKKADIATMGFETYKQVTAYLKKVRAEKIY